MYFFSVGVKRAALSVICAVPTSEKTGRQKLSWTYFCNILIAAAQRTCTEATITSALTVLQKNN